MSKTLHILVDGDYIAYAAGFASERKRYLYALSDPARGVSGTYITLANATEAKEKEGDAYDPSRLYENITADPPGLAASTAISMLDRALREAYAKFGGPEGGLIPKTYLYLSGEGNFRHQIATLRPYKGNRVQPKPVNFMHIREALRLNRRAMLVFDQEPDDAIGILATRLAEAGEDYVIVGVDKDLLQIPGAHYNPNKGFAVVSKEKALRLLYLQCLTGDSTDNIPGCVGVGEVKARKILDGAKDEKRMWELVISAYAVSRKKNPDAYNDVEAYEAAVENMRLVYLRRKPDEIWQPPK